MVPYREALTRDRAVPNFVIAAFPLDPAPGGTQLLFQLAVGHGLHLSFRLMIARINTCVKYTLLPFRHSFVLPVCRFVNDVLRNLGMKEEP